MKNQEPADDELWFTRQKYGDENIELHALNKIALTKDIRSIFSAQRHTHVLGLNLSELLFLLHYEAEGFTVTRLPLAKYGGIASYFGLAIHQQTGINPRYLRGGAGVPDFMVQRPNAAPQFIEVKQTETKLSSSQVAWIEKTGIDVHIVKLAKKYDGDRRLSTDEILALNHMTGEIRGRRLSLP